MQPSFDSCDGALWELMESEVSTALYEYQDKKIKPGELGYKYHVLTYKNNDHSSAEILSAYIGDVKYFIDNHVKAGYNGLMVKDKVIPKKEIKTMFKLILQNHCFPTNVINNLVKQV